MLVEGLEFDLDRGVGHDLVQLAVLLPADELAVLVGELELEPDFRLEGLRAEEVR